jgi:hypothetical protein
VAGGAAFWSTDVMRFTGLFALFATLGACAVDTDERPASWTYIHTAIVLPNCATSGCHSAFSQTHGVSLQDAAAARALFVDGTIDTPLLRGQQAGVGRMPRDQPLPAADIALIQRWIDEGMQDN